MVSKKVASRIVEIAAEIGYARSPLASGLRTGKSFTIGVIVPDLTNPMFPPIVRGIERTLESGGYIAILADSDNSQKGELAILDSMTSRRIDGVILATARLRDPVVDNCVAGQLPLVLVNRTTDAHNVSEVVNNDALGIRLACEHLKALGHTRIAYLGGPQNTSTGRDRYRAFVEVMHLNGCKFLPTLCVNCPTFTESAGREGMLRLLDSKEQFSAVIAANDLLAIGIYDALDERHLSCPTDMSVTGFNDMPMVGRIAPPLTSLHVSLDDLGVHAATALLAEIQNSNAPRKTIRLDPRLIVRASTGSPSVR